MRGRGLIVRFCRYIDAAATPAYFIAGPFCDLPFYQASEILFRPLQKGTWGLISKWAMPRANARQLDYPVVALPYEPLEAVGSLTEVLTEPSKPLPLAVEWQESSLLKLTISLSPGAYVV